ncbi:hypothetical protein ACWAUC_18895 [Bradyrhizobium guangdongense]
MGDERTDTPSGHDKVLAKIALFTTIASAVAGGGSAISAFRNANLNGTGLVAATRAWLVPVSASFAEPIGEHSRITIALKNEGKTPAVGIRQVDETPELLEFRRLPSGVPYIDSTTPKWPMGRLCPTKQNGGRSQSYYPTLAEPLAPIYPSQEATYTRHIPRGEVERLKPGGDRLLLIRGCFVYRDEFGEKLSPYCFYSVPAASVDVDWRDQKFARCPRGAEDPT